MKPFTFPLEAVLTLRKLEEERALEAYASAVHKCVELRGRSERAGQRQRYLNELIGQQRTHTFSANLQEAYATALDEARDETERTLRDLADAEQQKGERLRDFLLAKQKAEILERLRDKKRRVHHTEEQRREEIMIEDLTISRRATAAPLRA